MKDSSNGFGVLDELAVDSVGLGAAEQDRRAERNPERGDVVISGRSGGVLFVDLSRAVPGSFGDVR